MESNSPIFAVLVSLALNIINSLAAFILINYAKDKEWNKFLKIIFGGMLIRMLFILSVVAIGVKILMLHTAYFSISLVILYFFMLLAEIIYLNYRTNFVNLHNKKIQKAK